MPSRSSGDGLPAVRIPADQDGVGTCIELHQPAGSRPAGRREIRYKASRIQHVDYPRHIFANIWLLSFAAVNSSDPVFADRGAPVGKVRRVSVFGHNVNNPRIDYSFSALFLRLRNLAAAFIEVSALNSTPTQPPRIRRSLDRFHSAGRRQFNGRVFEPTGSLQPFDERRFRDQKKKAAR